MDGALLTPSCGCDDLPHTSRSPLMSVADAVARAKAQVAPLAGGETLETVAAIGRRVQADILAPVAMPLFDNSAMDGFALRCADLAGGDTLPIAGTVAAGDRPGALVPGTALRIYTGAPLPAGADAVVMVERCHDSGDRVRITSRPVPGDNIRRKGSDQDAGQVLIAAGTRIAPHHAGLLAANGLRRVTVARRPRVAVFSTGDELTDGTPTPGQIPDANRPMLLALARQAGADVTDLGILPDELEVTRAALSRAGANFDLVLTSGAVSMGGKDHVGAALQAAGGHLDGWRVALKPGKPVMFGRLDRAAFTGLPGNPLAVLVGFHLFVAPQIARLAGGQAPDFATVPARAGFDWHRKPGRAEVFPVQLSHYDDTGLPVLNRLGQGVSASLLPVADADGLAVVDARTDRVRPGDALHWQPFCKEGGVI